MTREEIIEGLRGIHAVTANYKGDQVILHSMPMTKLTAILYGAAELLKAEAPRVLTLEEAQAIKAPETLVWLETSGGYDGSRYRAIPAIISDNTHGILTNGAMHFYNTTDRAWSAYNREICGWRLWTSEPSDRRRLEAKWEG